VGRRVVAPRHSVRLGHAVNRRLLEKSATEEGCRINTADVREETEWGGEEDRERGIDGLRAVMVVMEGEKQTWPQQPRL
jgi:hypothetical protein